MSKFMFQNLDLGEGEMEAFDSALEFLQSKDSLQRDKNTLESATKPIVQLLSEFLPKIRGPEKKVDQEEVDQEEVNFDVGGIQRTSTGEKAKQAKASVSLSVFLGLEEAREPLPPHACDHCNKRFELQWDLHVHLKKIHSIEPYHACQQCPRVFTRREDFERHLIGHGERNFKCHVCGIAFLRQESLERHIENNHDLPKEISTFCMNIISSLNLGEKDSETQQCKVDTRTSNSSFVQPLVFIHSGESDGTVTLEVAKDEDELYDSDETVCPDDDDDEEICTNF